MHVMVEQSVVIPDAARSQKKTLDATSRTSDAIDAPSFVFAPTVDCFVRAGLAPAAVNDGTDLFLYGGNIYRVISGWTPGWKLAFITAGQAGSIYITPGA